MAWCVAGLSLVLLVQSGSQVEPQPRTAGAGGEYEIGAGDILKVTVYGHADLNHTVVVQPDGTFIFPLIGRVKAEGLTPNALELKLATLLGAGYIRNPQVTVVIQEYRSKTVFVVGEVARPGLYALSESRTVVEVLSRAGPLTTNAGAEVIVVRPSEPVDGPLLPGQLPASSGSGADAAGQRGEVIRVSIRDIQAGDLSQNVALRPNDTVFVPQAPKVFVSGEVKLPGAYAVLPGTTVRQAISLAGGFTEHAATGGIKVVRQVAGKSKDVKVKLDDPVLPGDTVVVKQRLF
jgi:polysaccharide export outer membrane protein